jgi:enterochelin esterase-like enzyme
MQANPAGAARLRRRDAAAMVAAAIVIALSATSCGGTASAPANAPGTGSSQTPPQVLHTGKPPTGYTVTFSFRAPTAKQVQIEGEWSFSNSAHPAQGLLASQWSPGDFPLALTDTTGWSSSWPVMTMTQNGQTGLWTYTTPLPSGIFTYRFFVDCFDPTQTGCTGIADPSNPPWNARGAVTKGSVEPTSQVYVPSDPSFHTVNYSWEAPNRKHGSVVELTYPSPQSIDPAGTHALAVYTPPGYDSHRTTPYPTVYLSHGYGGNEVEWTTQGDAANIVDNLIASGAVQPMVLVMTNFSGFADDCKSNATAWADEADGDLIGNVIPYVEGHYHVSTQPSDRAVAGLSCGGILADTLGAFHTGEFGFYGTFSPAPGGPQANATPSLLAALQKVGLFVGGGLEDPIHSVAAELSQALEQLKLNVTTEFIDGGHDWFVWRVMLRDFLTRVAFRPIA